MENSTYLHDEPYQPKARQGTGPKAERQAAGQRPRRLHLGRATRGSRHRGHSFSSCTSQLLSQTDKAKATEAKTHLASTLKQGHAKFLEDGDAPETTNANMNSTWHATRR